MEDKNFVKFYSNINVDYVKVERNITSFAEALVTREERHSTTVLISDFTTDINASYYPSESELDNTRFSIYRKNYYQNYYDYLFTLEDNKIFFKDYNIENNNYYHYMTCAEISYEGEKEFLTFENTDEEGKNAFIKANWNNYSICDIVESENQEGVYKKTGSVWLFKNNLESGDVVQNLNVTMTPTLGKYDKAFIGAKNCESGKITCLLGEVRKYGVLDENNLNKDAYGYTERVGDYTYYEKQSQKLEEWKNFCSNGNLKLLKNISGESWIVQIIETPSHSTVLACENPVNTISFSWQEAMDKNEVSIVETL